MKNSTLVKLLAALAVMIFVIVTILNHQKMTTPETPKPAPTSSPVPENSAAAKPPAAGAAQSQPVPEPESGGLDRSQLPHEQVEAWLKLHDRDAASLLAAFRATNDTNYLNEAALKFPNDPKVEWTVLAHDAFPADRRKWLELFKQSSPDNAVAFYLSTEDYFKNGQSGAAMQELQIASDKVGFDNYENESREDSEDLYAYLGKTKLEAAEKSMADLSGELMPTLAAFKRVGEGLAAAQKKALAAGDLDAVSDLYDMETSLADNLQNGDGGDYLAAQLAGLAEQTRFLSQLKPNTHYDFLDDDQTPAQMLQELRDQKNSIARLVKSFQTAYPSLTPEEMLDYTERVKDDGELDAMQWAVEKHPQGSR